MARRLAASVVERDVNRDPAYSPEELERLALDDEHRLEKPTTDAGEVPRQPDVPPPSDKDAPALRRSRLDPDDPKPQIVLSADRSEVVDAAERALAAMGGVYVRGRRLVRVVRDRGLPGWLKRPQGSPVIVPIDRDHLLDRLGRVATWLVVKDDAPRKTSPPVWVAAMLLARGEWNLPQLESIADAPVFRADGSILDVAGYDAQTRVIYDPCGATFPPVPAAPSREHATSALADLLEPFAEFPFVAAAIVLRSPRSSCRSSAARRSTAACRCSLRRLRRRAVGRACSSMSCP